MNCRVGLTRLDPLECGARDMTWIRHGKYTVYLAGGMSWGDSPGETYEEFYRFNTLFYQYNYIDECLVKGVVKKK